MTTIRASAAGLTPADYHVAASFESEVRERLATSRPTRCW